MLVSYAFSTLDLDQDPLHHATDSGVDTGSTVQVKAKLAPLEVTFVPNSPVVCTDSAAIADNPNEDLIDEVSVLDDERTAAVTRTGINLRIPTAHLDWRESDGETSPGI